MSVVNIVLKCSWQVEKQGDGMTKIVMTDYRLYAREVVSHTEFDWWVLEVLKGKKRLFTLSRFFKSASGGCWVGHPGNHPLFPRTFVSCVLVCSLGIEHLTCDVYTYVSSCGLWGQPWKSEMRPDSIWLIKSCSQLWLLSLNPMRTILPIGQN